MEDCGPSLPAAVVRTTAFALVVLRHPDGRFCLVRETEGRGWWLPGGGVEARELCPEAALREVSG